MITPFFLAQTQACSTIEIMNVAYWVAITCINITVAFIPVISSVLIEITVITILGKTNP
jgi:hypothetical protein